MFWYILIGIGLILNTIRFVEAIIRDNLIIYLDWNLILWVIAAYYVFGRGGV